MSERSRITIIYKSGATMDLTCDSFTVETVNNEITGVAWSGAPPNPLHVGIEGIAAVWECVGGPEEDVLSGAFREQA
jgi:hypothetical protein